MDSTPIKIECTDEGAEAAGRKAEVAAITDARRAARSMTTWTALPAV
jgi:phosphoserine phosphatase